MKLKFGLRLQVWVHYPNGKKKKAIDRQSRSFVQAFIDTISGSFRDSAHTFKDTSGVDRANLTNCQANGAAGDVNYGIVIGNGFSDVLPGNYALSARMGHGVGAGQMTHDKQLWGSINTGIANKRSFEFYRYFWNLYSLAQTVRECGLYVKVQGGSVYFCFVRDLLGSLEIPSKGGISIHYKVEITI